MCLQHDLHLPTRQRNDGHHESQSSLSKQTQSRIRSWISRSFIVSVTAAAFTLSSNANADRKPVGTWGWTSGSATYLRIRPGSQTPAVAKVPRRTQLMVWGTFNGWYRVETTDHKFGWIHHDYVSVPNPDKLHELSHFKAKKASDTTGNQMLYGRPEQLKKYYARYGAKGAQRGLEKQGVRVVSHTKPKTIQPTAVKVVSHHTAPKPKVAKTMAPRPVTVNIPDANLPAQLPAQAQTIQAPPATLPTPVVIRGTSKTSAPKPVVVVEKSPTTESTTQPTNISAADIMNARAEYLRRQLASRHKSRPTSKAKPAPPALRPESKSSEAVASVQPTAYRTGDAALVSTADLQTSPVPIKGEQATAASPINGEAIGSGASYQAVSYAKSTSSGEKKAEASRGGSPRDYARYAASNKKFGSAMANQALSYRGRPYISGAANPRRGFDCSGLVYYLLRQRGYNPPRTAAGMSHFGKPVAKKDLKPGDIVFFANTYKRGVSHVGIYIGNNNFVHAANHRSGVKTDSLGSSYYARKYYGARRIK